MIVLFTDFGRSGPYIAQMQAVLLQQAAGVPIVDLFADAPMFDPISSSHLLAAYGRDFPPKTVFLCVVDPGVGSKRRPLVVELDGRYYVGPDNGLFSVVIQQAVQARAWQISYRPERLSNTFHGRDLFAPVAAQLATGLPVPGSEIDITQLYQAPLQDNELRIIYIDHYGNCISNLPANVLAVSRQLRIADRQISYAANYAAVERGQLFWYQNSSDLIEIAENCGSAAKRLSVEVGMPLMVSG